MTDDQSRREWVELIPFERKEERGRVAQSEEMEAVRVQRVAEERMAAEEEVIYLLGSAWRSGQRRKLCYFPALLRLPLPLQRILTPDTD